MDLAVKIIFYESQTIEILTGCIIIKNVILNKNKVFNRIFYSYYFLYYIELRPEKLAH